MYSQIGTQIEANITNIEPGETLNVTTNGNVQIATTATGDWVDSKSASDGPSASNITLYEILGNNHLYVAPTAGLAPGTYQGQVTIELNGIVDVLNYNFTVEAVNPAITFTPVSYTHLPAHETREDKVCRLRL